MAKGGMVTVTIGGWYQRTTLHLSEVHEFLAFGTSRLPLDAKALKKNRANLRLKSVTRESGELEFVHAFTRDGIEIFYYEDGLYILRMKAGSVVAAQKTLQSYFEEYFSPSVAYIFSRGAPTPKVIANIPSSHPVVVTIESANPRKYIVDEKQFHSVYQRIESDHVVVCKTESHILIIADPSAQKSLDALVDLQIFFREFKDQLGKYLQIHRTIWEDIAVIKERRSVKAKEAQMFRNQLESYLATVNLIDARINQMGTYVNTRRSLAQKYGLEDELRSLFQYRFEVLTDTLAYIKDLWQMTKTYLQSAIEVLVEVLNNGTKSSIQSLRTITTFGVLANIVVFMSRVTTPTFINHYGVYALGFLLVLAWGVDRALGALAQHKSYAMKFTERTDKI